MTELSPQACHARGAPWAAHPEAPRSRGAMHIDTHTGSEMHTSNQGDSKRR